MDETYHENGIDDSHGLDDGHANSSTSVRQPLDDSFFESVTEIINENTAIERDNNISQVEQEPMSSIYSSNPEGLWPNDLVEYYDPANLSGLENAEDNLICIIGDSISKLVLSEDSAPYINGQNAQYLNGLENPNDLQHPKDNITWVIEDSIDNLVSSEELAAYINVQFGNVPITSIEECPTGSNEQIDSQITSSNEQIDAQLAGSIEQIDAGLTGRPIDLQGIQEEHTDLSFASTSENSFSNLGLNAGATDYVIEQQESQNSNSQDINGSLPTLNDRLLSTNSTDLLNNPYANVENKTSTNDLGTDEELFLINIPVDADGNLDLSGFTSDFINSLLGTTNGNQTGNSVDNEGKNASFDNVQSMIKSVDGADDACLEPLSNTMVSLQSDSGVDINSLLLNQPPETNSAEFVSKPCKKSFKLKTVKPKLVLPKTKSAKKKTTPNAGQVKKKIAGRKKNNLNCFGVFPHWKMPKLQQLIRCYPIKTEKSVKDVAEIQCIKHSIFKKQPTSPIRSDACSTDTTKTVIQNEPERLLKLKMNRESEPASSQCVFGHKLSDTFIGTITTSYDDYIEEDSPELEKMFKSKRKLVEATLPEDNGKGSEVESKANEISTGSVCDEANEIQASTPTKVRESIVTFDGNLSAFITVRNGVLAPKRRKVLCFESDSDDSDYERLHTELKKAKSFRCKNCMKSFICGKSWIRHSKSCTLHLPPKSRNHSETFETDNIIDKSSKAKNAEQKLLPIKGKPLEIVKKRDVNTEENPPPPAERKRKKKSGRKPKSSKRKRTKKSH